jgi:signal transduction histidine kinase
MTEKKNSLTTSQLKDFSLLTSLTPEQLRGGDLGQVVSLKSNQVVFKQGEYPAAVFLILKGGVRIEGEDSFGKVYVYGEIGKGRVFGELGLLRGESSRVTATTVRDTEVIMIDRAVLLALIRNADPEHVLNVFLAVDEQTRAATEVGFREVMSQRMLASQMEAEKQRALTQMVAGVAHDVNTSLSVINTAVTIMARELAAPLEVTIQRAADIAEPLELMRLNVERAQQLVQNFKKISVSQLKEEKEPFDIVEAIEDTIGLVRVSLKRNQVQTRFHNKLTPDQRKWEGYRSFISQVLINLLTNAERYAYPKGVGGAVDVTIRMEDDDHYCLGVKDHGRGIAKEDQGQIFSPFYTTGKNSGGTGLGLAIVHNLVVNAFKGEIRLKSEEGKGAEFLVVFPRVVPE